MLTIAGNLTSEEKQSVSTASPRYSDPLLRQLLEVPLRKTQLGGGRFWSASIAAEVSGIFFFHKTYAPNLSKGKADRLRNEITNEKLQNGYESDEIFRRILEVALARPFRLLATQPVIFTAAYMAYLSQLLPVLRCQGFPDFGTASIMKEPE